MGSLCYATDMYSVDYVHEVWTHWTYHGMYSAVKHNESITLQTQTYQFLALPLYSDGQSLNTIVSCNVVW